MTLIEMTVVILVLVSLISMLFISAKAWKRGADRTGCILIQHNVQKGVRSFSNLYGFSPGDNVVGLRERVIGPGRFIEQPPLCPGSGFYAYGVIGDEANPDMIPLIGTPYATCSLPVTEEHYPSNVADW